MFYGCKVLHDCSSLVVVTNIVASKMHDSTFSEFQKEEELFIISKKEKLLYFAISVEINA